MERWIVRTLDPVGAVEDRAADERALQAHDHTLGYGADERTLGTEIDLGAGHRDPPHRGSRGGHPRGCPPTWLLGGRVGRVGLLDTGATHPTGRDASRLDVGRYVLARVQLLGGRTRYVFAALGR